MSEDAIRQVEQARDAVVREPREAMVRLAEAQPLELAEAVYQAAASTPRFGPRRAFSVRRRPPRAGVRSRGHLLPHTQEE